MPRPVGVDRTAGGLGPLPFPPTPSTFGDGCLVRNRSSQPSLSEKGTLALAMQFGLLPVSWTPR
jgi:hypothetical protein